MFASNIMHNRLILLNIKRNQITNYKILLTPTSDPTKLFEMGTQFPCGPHALPL